MTKIVHPIAGSLAMISIAVFWFSTVLVELLGATSQIAAVKLAIPWGFLVVIPALAATGATGLIRARGRPGGVLGKKVRRMPIIAANGLLILVPSALFLAAKAGRGEFDSAFYMVQLIELCAGAINLALLGISMRDGLRLSGRLGRKFSASL